MMTSRATESVQDGTLFATIRYATFNHAQFTELLETVAARAADMRSEFEGMEDVSANLDMAVEAMSAVYLWAAAERATALHEARSEDDRRDA